MRVCATGGCENAIPPRKGRQAERLFCVTCRPPRTKPRVVGLTKPQPAGLVESYRRQLDAAGRLDSPEGAQVMLLADMLAAGGDVHSAAGAASLSKELRAALADALRGVPIAGDRLDELTKRREAKAQGA